MNPDVINGLGLDGQDGHHLVWPPCKCQFHRDEQYQILPAYAQDGIVLFRVFRGSTDAAVFEDFINRLLQHCGRWPEPKSVLVMDNALLHHSERIVQMCVDAGVKLLYLTLLARLEPD